MTFFKFPTWHGIINAGLSIVRRQKPAKELRFIALAGGKGANLAEITDVADTVFEYKAGGKL